MLTERPPDEFGEADEQFPGTFWIRSYIRFDGSKCVVDEMRADLRPEKIELRLPRAGTRSIEFREGQVGRHESRHLARGPQQNCVRRWGQCRQGPDDRSADGDGRGDPGLDRAI